MNSISGKTPISLFPFTEQIAMMSKSNQTDAKLSLARVAIPAWRPYLPDILRLSSLHSIWQSAGSGFQPLLHALGCGTSILSITFGPIVGNAEHLAVLCRTSAALAPCGNVVRVHFGELPYFALIGSMADCADADPHAGCCGKGGRETPAYPIRHLLLIKTWS